MTTKCKTFSCLCKNALLLFSAKHHLIDYYTLNAVSLLGQTQPEKLFSNPLETSLGDLNIQISQSKNGITLSTRI